MHPSIVLIEGEGAISEHQDNLCHDTDIYRKFYCRLCSAGSVSNTIESVSGPHRLCIEGEMSRARLSQIL